MKPVMVWLLCSAFLCGFAAQGTADTVKVVDMVGREVIAPVDPERIACIGPGVLRLMVYLQAQDKVACVEQIEKRNIKGRPYRLANPQFAKLSYCGPGGPAVINKKPDLEAVLSIKPQVVFMTFIDRDLADQIQKILAVPVVVLSYGGYAAFDEEVYKSLSIAGRILNRDKRAYNIKEFIESKRIDLRKRTADIESNLKPKVYVGGIGYRGAFGIESTEKKYIPFDWVNADNLAEGAQPSDSSHVFMDKELLLKLDPDVIFIDGGGFDLVAEDYQKKPQYYRNLKSFREKRIYALLPFNYYSTNIETALANAYAIGKILYPHKFKDIDPEVKADEIYEFMVGCAVYQNMKKDFGKLGRKVSFYE